MILFLPGISFRVEVLRYVVSGILYLEIKFVLIVLLSVCKVEMSLDLRLCEFNDPTTGSDFGILVKCHA